MLQNLLERLQETYRRYRRPAFVLLMDGILYNLLGGVTTECSRCPMPPMSAWERGLFAFSYFLVFVGVWWIVLIAMARSSSEFTDLDG